MIYYIRLAPPGAPNNLELLEALAHAGTPDATAIDGARLASYTPGAMFGRQWKQNHE